MEPNVFDNPRHRFCAIGNARVDASEVVGLWSDDSLGSAVLVRVHIVLRNGATLQANVENRKDLPALDYAMARLQEHYFNQRDRSRAENG